MNIEQATKIVKQMENRVDDLCGCVFEKSKKPSCNGCREKAIQVVLKEIERLNNIINEFDDFITNVDSHINLGDESEEFILVRDKWLELQELKGVDKEC